jgi:hypothetical protein
LKETKQRQIVGEYIVDLYPANGRVYYTVTRKGTADLLSVGEEATMKDALKEAKWTIRKFGISGANAQSA